MTDPSTAPAAAQIIDSLMPAITGALVLLGGLAGTFLAHMLKTRADARRARDEAVLELIDAVGALSIGSEETGHRDVVVLMKAESRLLMTMTKVRANRFLLWWHPMRKRLFAVSNGDDHLERGRAAGKAISGLRSYAVTRRIKVVATDE